MSNFFIFFLILLFISINITFARKYDSHSRESRATKKPFLNNVIICYQDLLKTIQCPENQIIKIKSAYYGRSNLYTCVSDPGSNYENCVSEISTYYYQLYCNGLNTCSINSFLISLFQLPLVYVPIYGNTFFCSSQSVSVLPIQYNAYLNITYSCSEPLVLCKEESYKAKCPKGQVMTVISSFFGRKDSDICSTSDSHEQSYFQSSDSTLALQKSCNGKTNCLFKASARALGIRDNFRKISKYLEVDYTCSAPTVFCLRNDGNIIGCPRNNVLKIHSAFYGASTNLACPGLSSIPGQNDCKSSDVLSFYQNLCNGQSLCSLNLNKNPSLLIPPISCNADFVYLQLSYTCIQSQINA